MRHVTGIELIEVSWTEDDNGFMRMSEIPGSESIITADLVLLSMGFLNPVQKGIIDSLKLSVNERKNIIIDPYHRTSHPKVFAAGDAHLGASLVVRAIQSGRKTAESIHGFLMKS